MAEGEFKDCSIFPPSSHEGLHIQSEDQRDQPSSSSSSLSSSPLSSSLPSNFDISCTVLGFGLPRWFAFGLHHLHYKLLAIASTFRRYSSTRLTLWPFGTAAGVIMALLLSFVYITLRRHRHRLHSSEGTLDHLMRLIKERDEKIIQLLNQIIRMNEALLAYHGVRAVESD